MINNQVPRLAPWNEINSNWAGFCISA